MASHNYKSRDYEPDRTGAESQESSDLDDQSPDHLGLQKLSY